MEFTSSWRDKEEKRSCGSKSRCGTASDAGENHHLSFPPREFTTRFLQHLPGCDNPLVACVRSPPSPCLHTTCVVSQKNTITNVTLHLSVFSFEEMRKDVKQRLHTERLKTCETFSVATPQKDHRLHDNKVWITDTTTDTVVGMRRAADGLCPSLDSISRVCMLRRGAAYANVLTC